MPLDGDTASYSLAPKAEALHFPPPFAWQVLLGDLASVMPSSVLTMKIARNPKPTAKHESSTSEPIFHPGPNKE